MEVQRNRKKLLIIHNKLRGWGQEKNLILIGKYIDKNRFDVSYLLTTQKRYSFTKNFNNAMAVFLLQTPQVRKNKYTWFINAVLKFIYLVFWLKKNGRDINYLLISNLDECIVAFIAKKVLRLKSKFVIFNQIHLSASKEKIDMFLRALVNIFILCNRFSDGILCLSKGIAQDLMENYNIKNKIFVHSGCIDFQEVDKLCKEKVEEAWLMVDKRKTIVYVGRLYNKQKRIDILLKAINIIKQMNENIRAKVLIIGDGKERAYLESMAKELNLEEIVYFLGYKDNPYKYYAISDLFVLTSDFEGFANVIIEAMACGLPVISTDCTSGPSEILENGKWGILINRGDYKALASNMLYILKNEELQRELRNKSLMRVKDFEYKKVFETFQNSIAFI